MRAENPTFHPANLVIGAGLGRTARLSAHDLMTRRLARCTSLRVLTVAGRTAQISEVYQGLTDHLEPWALEQDTS